ncbi:MAG TPA: UvrD-helicase domain-containing protein [Candidatus Nitrosotenuis sp.]|nr:UvrD-helicase domain-containing protein [Candidatus Nitrosotenuis sp.]
MGRILLTRRAARQLAEERDGDLLGAFLATLHRLREGRITPGDHPEIVLRRPAVVLSVRATDEQRVFCTLTGERQNRDVWVWYLGRSHDEGYRAIQRLGFRELERGPADWLEVEELVAAGAIPLGERFFELTQDLGPENNLQDYFSRLDLHLALDPVQREILEDSRSNFVVSGGPGTGKTVLAIYRAMDLLRAGKEVFFFTFNRTLRTVCRAYVKKCLGGVYLERIRLPDFPEFVRECLGELCNSPVDLPEEESQKVLEELLLKDTSLLEVLMPWHSELWRNVRGFALERCPGEAARKQAKQHGREVQAAWVELARLYQEEKGERRDWCDHLKDLLSMLSDLRTRPGRSRAPIGLVVDEIQDFTLLESQLILGWHRWNGNDSVPFLLTGDQGQQISHFGFAWDDVEDYLRKAKILFERRQLTQIYRNGNHVVQAASPFSSRLRGRVDRAEGTNVPGLTPLLCCLADGQDLWSILRELGDAGRRIKNVPIITLDATLTAPEDIPALVLSVADSKGLEFDQAILLGLFAEKSGELTQTALQTYHMLLTRSRRRFLAMVNREVYEFLKAREDRPDWAKELMRHLEDVHDPKFALSQFLETVDEELSPDVAVHLELASARSFQRLFHQNRNLRHLLDAAQVYLELDDYAAAAECFLTASRHAEDPADQGKHFAAAMDLYLGHSPLARASKIEQLIGSEPVTEAKARWLVAAAELYRRAGSHPDELRVLQELASLAERAAEETGDLRARVELLKRALDCWQRLDAQQQACRLRGTIAQSLEDLAQSLSPSQDAEAFASKVKYLEEAGDYWDQAGKEKEAQAARLQAAGLCLEHDEARCLDKAQRLYNLAKVEPPPRLYDRLAAFARNAVDKAKFLEKAAAEHMAANDLEESIRAYNALVGKLCTLAAKMSGSEFQALLERLREYYRSYQSAIARSPREGLTTPKDPDGALRPPSAGPLQASAIARSLREGLATPEDPDVAPESCLNQRESCYLVKAKRQHEVWGERIPQLEDCVLSFEQLARAARIQKTIVRDLEYGLFTALPMDAPNMARTLVAFLRRVSAQAERSPDAAGALMGALIFALLRRARRASDDLLASVGREMKELSAEPLGRALARALWLSSPPPRTASGLFQSLETDWRYGCLRPSGWTADDIDWAIKGLRVARDALSQE